MEACNLVDLVVSSCFKRNIENVNYIENSCSNNTGCGIGNTTAHLVSEPMRVYCNVYACTNNKNTAIFPYNYKFINFHPGSRNMNSSNESVDSPTAIKPLYSSEFLECVNSLL